MEERRQGILPGGHRDSSQAPAFQEAMERLLLTVGEVLTPAMPGGGGLIRYRGADSWKGLRRCSTPQYILFDDCDSSPRPFEQGAGG